jgi:predicted Holliday junction resolvase-like endonuclease
MLYLVHNLIKFRGYGMAFEYAFLFIGLILGALFVYILLSRRIIAEAEKRAQQIAQQVQNKAEETAKRLFNAQKSQLEQSINQTYTARLEEWKASILKDTITTEKADALDRARSVLKGKIGEQIAPLLPEFLALCNPSDARFIGSPIDYLIFRNMTCEEGNELPIEVILLDVKTGKSGLNKIQKRIQEAVEHSRVRFHTLRLSSREAGEVQPSETITSST